MSTLTTQTIEANSADWLNFISSIILKFAPGEVISHAHLKEVFNIPRLEIADFESTDDFVKALNDAQFMYMSLVDKLREDLLLNENYYLENLLGQGYRLLPPSLQQQYGYQLAIKEIKRIIRQSMLIMKHVRLDAVDNEARTKGSDLSAKLSMIAQLFSSMRK
jgi:hypothetical protein